MTDQTTVTAAVAKREDSPTAIVQAHRDDLATVAATHINPDTFVRLAVGALRRDEKLRRAATANPGSLMATLMECARLGHEPATENYAIVWYQTKNGPVVDGIEQYRGVIERIYRAGAVSSVKCELVYSNDQFTYHPHMDRPQHYVQWFEDRGGLLGAYAYAHMLDGTPSKVVVIDMPYVAKVRAQSKGSDNASSPWVKWFPQMVLKTAALRLEAWVPTSSEWLRNRAQIAAETQTDRVSIDGRAVARVQHAPDSQRVDVETGEVLDGELVDAPDSPRYEPEPEPEQGISPQQMKALQAGFKAIGVTDRDERLRRASRLTGREIGSANDLTYAEASTVLNYLNDPGHLDEDADQDALAIFDDTPAEDA